MRIIYKWGQHVLILRISQVTQDEGVKEALQGVQQGARKAPFPRVLDPRCDPAQFLAPAFRWHFHVIAGPGEAIGRASGRAIVVRSRGVRFILFYSFFLSSGEAQKEKKKSTQKGGKHKKNNSRSMTTRERSSVQSVRSSVWRGTRGKSKKLPGLVCVVW